MLKVHPVRSNHSAARIRSQRILILFLGVVSLSMFLLSIEVSASNHDDSLGDEESHRVSAENPLGTDVPIGPGNFDTPLTEYIALTGTIRVATGGISLFPVKTADSFIVDIPACASGDKPLIHVAYLEWYQRWRGPASIVDAAGGTPTFDDDIEINLNGNGATAVTVNSSAWGRFNMVNPTADNRVFIRRNAMTDVTAQLDADWVDGNNSIAVSGLNRPTPTTVSNSDNYGVGIHVFYECPEYEYSRVGFSTGLDWFYGSQEQPYAGRYSDLVCFEFPAATQSTQIDVDSILGGQAQENAPFRGARLFYKTGSGPMLTADATPNGPSGIVVGNGNDIPWGTQIGTGYQSIWTSSLGQEWDRFSAEDAITVNVGDEWVCLQAESSEDASSLRGISGDLFSIAFSIPLERPTDWGDLPEKGTDSHIIGEGLPEPPAYNTSKSSTVGPSHPIIPTLQIGATIDAEINGQPHANAKGDDNETTPGDDEDGIELPSVFKPGTQSTFTATVTNQTGQDAYLYGFVDWNGDGDFEDQNELARQVIPTGSITQTVFLTYIIPITESVKIEVNLGARFRFSTDSVLGPDGPATNGEVEDYLILIPTAVDLVQFNVSRTGQKQATLHWETATEIDNFGFRVLRSSTNTISDAQQIAFVPSSIVGGSGPGDRYKVVDDLPDFGTYTYWLVDVDTAGLETTHGPRTVTLSNGWQLFIPFITGE